MKNLSKYLSVTCCVLFCSTSVMASPNNNGYKVISTFEPVSPISSRISSNPDHHGKVNEGTFGGVDMVQVTGITYCSLDTYTRARWESDITSNKFYLDTGKIWDSDDGNDDEYSTASTEWCEVWEVPSAFWTGHTYYGY